MPGYTEVLREARGRGLALTSAGVQRLLAGFKEAARRIEFDLRASGNPIGQARAELLREQVWRIIEELEGRTARGIDRSVDLTIDGVTALHEDALGEMYAARGIDFPDWASEAFARVDVRAAAALASRRGVTFQTLLNRNVAEAGPALDTLISSAVARGVSTRELTRDIADLLATAEGANLSTYGLSDSDVSGLRTLYYDSRRIAVTETLNALRESQTQALIASPIVEAVKWQVSGAHPEEDECDLLAEADLYGYGPGYYPPEAFPLAPHPFCGCTQGGPTILRPVEEWGQPKDEPPEPDPEGMPPMPEGWSPARTAAAEDTLNRAVGISPQPELEEAARAVKPLTGDKAQEHIENLIGPGTWQLTDEEAVALRGWQAGSAEINDVLRGKKAYKDAAIWNREVIDTLPGLIERAPELERAIAAYRSVFDPKAVESMIGLKPGDIIRDDGFMATSLSKEQTINWARYRQTGSYVEANAPYVSFEIALPKGTKGLWPEWVPDSQTMSQSVVVKQEFLLPPGSRMEVTGIKAFNDRTGKAALSLEDALRFSKEGFPVRWEITARLVPEEAAAASTVARQGEQLVVFQEKTTAAWQRQVTAAIDELPPSIRGLVADKVDIVGGEKLGDLLPSWLDPSPRTPYIEGSHVWDAQAGRSRVMIAEKVRHQVTHKLVEAAAERPIGGVVTHEIGHAIDATLGSEGVVGTSHRAFRSLEPDFRAAWKADVEALKAKGLPAEYGELSYYARGATETALKEAFAESFALLHGEVGSTHWADDLFRKYFKRSMALVKHIIDTEVPK